MEFWNWRASFPAFWRLSELAIQRSSKPASKLIEQLFNCATVILACQPIGFLFSQLAEPEARERYDSSS
jgi:hypothetical protein